MHGYLYILLYPTGSGMQGFQVVNDRNGSSIQGGLQLSGNFEAPQGQPRSAGFARDVGPEH